MTTEPWMEHAACRGMNADLWFPNRNTDTTNAVAVCKGCPVRDACLDYAQRELIHHGIFGGYNANQRYRLRQQRRIGGVA